MTVANTKIYLDGKLVEGCIEVNEREGWLRKYLLDIDRHAIKDINGCPIVVGVAGIVRIDPPHTSGSYTLSV